LDILILSMEGSVVKTRIIDRTGLRKWPDNDPISSDFGMR
jgi:hypothetical protein